MSVPFAFNLEGESFALPSTAVGWRVKRLRGPGESGAPELVYNSEGLPLFLPLDANTDDLRRAVRGELGKYRLDPVDESNRVVKGADAGYVVLRAPDPSATPQAATPPTAPQSLPDGPNSNAVVMEALRQTTELARESTSLASTIVREFPSMLESAAVLLAAADGAGIVARPPRDGSTDLGEDNDASDEGGPSSTPRFDLGTLLVQVAPVIMTAIANGNFKMPSLAELLDWRKAAAARKETACPGSEAQPAAASAPKKTRPHAPSSATPAVETTAASEAEAPTERDIRQLSPEQAAHFMAILAALSPEEAALARAAAGELPPREQRAWLTELGAMTVVEAVERIRKLLSAREDHAA